MRIGKLEHATKCIALCLPPVVISLVGLESRKKGGTIVAGRKISPGVKRPLHGSS
jgi:hypothetical protein